jgi:cysteine-rich repeat protein
MRSSTGRGLWFVLGIGGVAWATTASVTSGCGGGDSSGIGEDEDTGIPTPDGGDGGDLDGADPIPVCGNGAKEGVEECDDGNKVDGDGCQADCTLMCKPGDPLRGDAKCDDRNPCNGVETCTAAKICSKGTPLKDGDSCGTGKTCKAGDCLVNSCGDSLVTAPEECDDGNVTKGDGCDDCKFSCVSTDATRNCPPPSPCFAAGTCNDAKHTCTAGAALADGTSCGASMICKAGSCVAAACGDGTLQAGEACDFGAGNGPGTGCEVDCKFSCQKTPTDTCLDTNTCNGTEVCANVSVGGATGQKCSAGTPLTDGTACPGGTCKGGVCASASCGNGTIDAGEDCDFGTGNGPGTGCELSCKFSCTTAPDSCPDTNPCNGTETCGTVTVGGKTGKKCSAGTALAACAACSAGGVCVSGTCKSSICGDSCVDASKSETCDPPATGTCDASCKTIVAAVCGNGKRETGEQCDDGNILNLDGCDSACKFEQDHRANSVKMQMGSGATDAFCTVNALGKAISSAASGQVQKPIDDGVAAGTMNIMFQFLNLDDLSGVADPAIVLGGLNGSVVTGTGYNGTSDLDWWYTADPLSIDSARKPTATLNGNITARTLNAGPGNMTLTVVLSGATVPLSLSSTRVRATTTTANKPLASTGAPPGHLASENLDPTLTSFPTMANGELCGNVSAYSLSKIPAPAAVLAGGSTACTEGYTASNSLLDVIVGGCTVKIIISVTAISPTQPDQSDPTAPVAGAGPLYKLVPGAGKAITSCKDKTGATVPDLTTCLKSAAYSAFFKFTTDRVIIK